jgi:hypothetical protein
MKTSSSFLLSMFFLFLISFASSGAEKTENRSIRDFSSIKVSAGIDLFLTMGDAESVKVVADEEIIDNIKTEVEGGTLKIYVKSKPFFLNWNKTRKVYVSFKRLVDLDASSGSDVVSENTLKGSKINISSSSGSDVNLKLEYDEIQVHSSSGSDAELSGSCNVLTASSSSGSNISAPELRSKVCHVDVSSGADAVVYVSDELNADASSGGDVRYLGNPKTKNINESSGGDVTAK